MNGQDWLLGALFNPIEHGQRRRRRRYIDGKESGFPVWLGSMVLFHETPMMEL